MAISVAEEGHCGTKFEEDGVTIVEMAIAARAKDNHIVLNVGTVSVFLCVHKYMRSKAEDYWTLTFNGILQQYGAARYRGAGRGRE